MSSAAAVSATVRVTTPSATSPDADSTSGAADTRPRLGPNRAGSVTGVIPNSGVLVLPTITAPAARSFFTIAVSNGGTQSPLTALPNVVRIPSVSGPMSLIAIGTPASGRGSPLSIASASASARSAATVTNAFTSPL